MKSSEYPPGHCDWHSTKAVEAEKVQKGALNYIQLRCPECGRRRGLRLIRSKR